MVATDRQQCRLLAFGCTTRIARMALPHPESTIGLLLSGGLDSAILLGHLVDQGHAVQPIYIRGHLFWEAEELKAVRRFVEAMVRSRADTRVGMPVVLDLPLGDVYGNHWSITGRDVPDDASPDEAVYLPGRNALLIIKAALWCQIHGVEELALAVLANNPFSDASTDFFEAYAGVLARATGSPLRITRPFGNLSKCEVMQRGEGLPLELTFSCISPVDGLHCGKCNKCAERRTAFRLIGVDDPTAYAKRQAAVSSQPLTPSP